MKRAFTVAVLILLTAVGARSQSQPSNSVTITVAAAPSFTITVAPLNYYANIAGQSMTVTVSAGPATSACSLTWDATVLPATFTPAVGTTPASFKVTAVPVAQLVAGSHAVVLNCPLPVLSLVAPVTLPNAKVGLAYSANLGQLAQVQGGVPPYTWTLDPVTPLPTGLSLSSAGIIGGVPSSPSSVSFNFTVKDSSGLAILVRQFKFIQV